MMKHHLAEILDVRLITPGYYQIQLHVEDFDNCSNAELDASPIFRAGQYCQLSINGQQAFYSIASAPHEIPLLELHIRVDDEKSTAFEIVESLKNDTHVTVLLPGGQAYLDDIKLEKPLTLIAGGTGFAPMQAILKTLKRNRPPVDNQHYPSCRLLWGAHQLTGFYALDWVKCLAAEHAWFDYQLITHEPIKNIQQGLLTDLLIKQLPAQNEHVFIAGQARMVKAAWEILQTHQFTRDQVHADMLDMDA